MRKQITKVHPPLTYAPRSLFPSMTFFYIEKTSHEIEYLHCVSVCNGKIAQQMIKLFSHRGLLHSRLQSKCLNVQVKHILNALLM